jgi:hypothetical protein
VFHRRLRVTVAGLWLAGVALAGFTAPRAWHRTGVASALPFVAVAVAGVVLARAVLRGYRAALALSAVLLGGQILGVIGSAWELSQPGQGSKGRELRRLGFDPRLGVVLNLLYSAIASAVFVWVATRWLSARRRPIEGGTG